jgi:hypothetical protein
MEDYEVEAILDVTLPSVAYDWSNGESRNCTVVCMVLSGMTKATAEMDGTDAAVVSTDVSRSLMFDPEAYNAQFKKMDGSLRYGEGHAKMAAFKEAVAAAFPSAPASKKVARQRVDLSEGPLVLKQTRLLAMGGQEVYMNLEMTSAPTSTGVVAPRYEDFSAPSKSGVATAKSQAAPAPLAAQGFVRPEKTRGQGLKPPPLPQPLPPKPTPPPNPALPRKLPPSKPQQIQKPEAMALVPKKATIKDPENLSSLAMAVGVLPVPPSEEIDEVPLDNPDYQGQFAPAQLVPFVPPPPYIPFIFSHDFGKPLKKRHGEEAGREEKKGDIWRTYVSKKRRKRRKRSNI